MSGSVFWRQFCNHFCAQWADCRCKSWCFPLRNSWWHFFVCFCTWSTQMYFFHSFLHKLLGFEIETSRTGIECVHVYLSLCLIQPDIFLSSLHVQNSRVWNWDLWNWNWICTFGWWWHLQPTNALTKDQVLQIVPNLTFCSAVFISICSKKQGMVHRPE
jgi:hypothetical protein